MVVPYGRQGMLKALSVLSVCSLLVGYMLSTSLRKVHKSVVRSEEAYHRDKMLLDYTQGLGALQSVVKLNRRKRLPDLIGIGVKKCGTGGLTRMLSKHPMARISTPIELHYFDRFRYKAPYENIEAYIEMMPEAYDFELVAEKSPSYFVSHRMQPQDIRDLVPNAKLFVVLCDPVNRTLSDFVHEVLHDNVEKGMSYDTFVRQNILEMSRILPALGVDIAVRNYIHQDLGYSTPILTRGLYYYHLQRWLQVYNRSEIFIVNGERLFTEPWEVMDEFQDFLGLPRMVLKEDFIRDPDSGFYYVMSRKAVHGDRGYFLVDGGPQFFNSSVKGRTRSGSSPYIPSAETVEIVRRFFEPYNKKLFDLLGQKFNWM